MRELQNMARVLHFTDFHEDTRKVDNATRLVERLGIDTVAITGDFIGKEHHRQGPPINSLDERLKRALSQVSQSESYQRRAELGERYGLQDGGSMESIPEEHRAEFAEVQEAFFREAHERVQEAINQSYAGIRPSLERLAATGVQVVGVAGNHDTKDIYGALGDLIDFAERKEAIQAGPLRIQGTPNTYEVPGESHGNGILGLLMKPHYIDYASGAVPGMASDNPELEEIIYAATERELARLGNEDCNILMTHKAPGGRFGSGKAAEEHAQRSGIVIGGHEHDGKIFKHKGKLTFNPGPNHSFVYSFGDDLELKSVEIYDIREAA